ncbi:MAG: hypothetical protein AB7I19_09260 [Planctomycetota bacterium]
MLLRPDRLGMGRETWFTQGAPTSTRALDLVSGISQVPLRCLTAIGDGGLERSDDHPVVGRSTRTDGMFLEPTRRDDGVHRREREPRDGAGPCLVAASRPSSRRWDPGRLGAVGKAICFPASSTARGPTRSDGTAAGTDCSRAFPLPASSTLTDRNVTVPACAAGDEPT